MYQIKVSTTQPTIDIVSSILWDVGACGVSIDQPFDSSEVDYDYLDQKLLMQCTKCDVVVSGFFECIKGVQQNLICEFAKLSENCIWDIGTFDLEICEVKYNWIEDFKKYFVDADYGKVVVVPEWNDSKFDKPTVKLQLAAAFGTGQHQTTRMCIEALQSHLGQKSVVADVGCGSGILGLVALSLGAKFVKFCDIDTQSTSVTQYNLNLNQVDTSLYQVCSSNLLHDDKKKYDLIIANLTASTLIQFADSAKENMHAHSQLIVSGIILDRLDELKAVYKSKMYNLIDTKIADDWALCIFKKDF
ncbi:MAG: 50S ribosomal protein L11 methyltransferase [Clostridiales bacterium]|jgi:ribosomal protein L11 methyltransferase|nr:50S ribosomal protein L11 methyltransferase [Clostridiales bacterium]